MNVEVLSRDIEDLPKASEANNAQIQASGKQIEANAKRMGTNTRRIEALRGLLELDAGVVRNLAQT